jgi:hypothetical protein
MFSHQFELTRFRCTIRRCGKTFIPPFPTARVGLLDSTRLEIFALYCCGYSPEEIQEVLRNDSGLEIQRSMIYRTLRPARQERIYAYLKQHHRALRRRRRRAATSGRRDRTFCGRWEQDRLELSTGVATETMMRTFRYDEGTVEADAVSQSVRLFNLYGDRVALNAVTWLEAFIEHTNEDRDFREKAYLIKARRYQDFSQGLSFPVGSSMKAMILPALRDAISKVEKI